jgi:GTP-binding protein
MVRVSNTPGRTREINFFRVNEAFMLVDLPGYGYARVSKEARASWKPLIEGYLRTSPQLRGIVQLVDARHDPTKDDLGMLDFLADTGIPTILVATKTDKLKPRELSARLGELAAVAGVEVEDVLPFSSATGAGRDELAEAMMGLLDQPHWRDVAEAGE